jgi:hypothetical protein
MRHLVAGLLTGVFLVVAVAAAFGDTETSGTTVQSFDGRFTTARAAKSAGFRISMASTDDTNQAGNRQPKRITNFDITFPKGSKVFTTAAPQCSANENDFADADDPDDVCPRGSKIGTGRAALRAPFRGIGDFPGVIDAYNAHKGVLLVVNFDSANLTWVLRSKFRGLKLLTTVPQTCVPPATPANDCVGQFGAKQELTLVQLSLNTKPRSRRTSRGVSRLMTTPATCPSNANWTFNTVFKYSGGTSVGIPSRSHCRR